MLEQDNDKALPNVCDDRKFLKKARKGICRRDDGHYELPLPLRDETIQLPNNKELALNRLKKLKGRLRSNNKYCKDYEAFMREIMEKELSLENRQIWYIPHHGVYHPKKPDTITVVFDAYLERPVHKLIFLISQD